MGSLKRVDIDPPYFDYPHCGPTWFLGLSGINLCLKANVKQFSLAAEPLGGNGLALEIRH